MSCINHLEIQDFCTWDLKFRNLYQIAVVDLNYFLMTLFEKNHFLADYQLIASLPSGAVSHNGSKQTIDYIYLIYRGLNWHFTNCVAVVNSYLHDF